MDAPGVVPHVPTVILGIIGSSRPMPTTFSGSALNRSAASNRRNLHDFKRLKSLVAYSATPYSDMKNSVGSSFVDIETLNIEKVP